MSARGDRSGGRLDRVAGWLLLSLSLFSLGCALLYMFVPTVDAHECESRVAVEPFSASRNEQTTTGWTNSVWGGSCTYGIGNAEVTVSHDDATVPLIGGASAVSAIICACRIAATRRLTDR